MASRSVADLYDVFSLRLEREILIKRRYAVRFRFGNADLAGNITEKFKRNITIFSLNILNYRDQRSLVSSMLRDDLVRLIIIGFV